jgi:hypothetical protein
MMARKGVKLVVEFDQSRFSVGEDRRWIFLGPGVPHDRVLFNPHFTDTNEFLQEREL